LHGIAKDFATRRPHYLSDFTSVFSLKVLSSSFYLFFACLANAIAFGALSSVLTGGEIGIIEMLIATAIGGTAYALSSAQPITLLGGTGPSSSSPPCCMRPARTSTSALLRSMPGPAYGPA
jgi:hypothetical protein